MVNLQDKPIVVGTPIEIESAVNEIRKQLALLPWVSHPYLIAERLYSDENGKNSVYPETYCKTDLEQNGKYSYHRLTPDNDYRGMFFAIVGDGVNDFKANEYNYIKYNVGFIFSVNLRLIDEVKLNQGLFTQELIRDARRVLTDTVAIHKFDYKIITETRNLSEVYKEFVLKDLYKYNKAPMQCFRFNLEILIQEEC